MSPAPHNASELGSDEDKGTDEHNIHQTDLPQNSLLGNKSPFPACSAVTCTASASARGLESGQATVR